MPSDLKHIRFDMKKERLQKALDGNFDIDDSLEFNASLHYVLYQQSFHKILTLNTKTYSYEYLEDIDEAVLIQEIGEEKERVVKKKQDEVNQFIKDLPDPHKYLTHKDIATALRASPPKTKVTYPLIKDSVLEKIVSDTLGDVSLELHEQELLVVLKQSSKLPYIEKEQEYNLELHVELNSLLEDIWLSKELDFLPVIAESKKEYEEQFLLDLKTIVEECKTYATLLHLSDEALHVRVYDISDRKSVV